MNKQYYNLVEIKSEGHGIEILKFLDTTDFRWNSIRHKNPSSDNFSLIKGTVLYLEMSKKSLSYSGKEYADNMYSKVPRVTLEDLHAMLGKDYYPIC